MACELFVFYFRYKTRFKQIDTDMFVEVILHKL